jgi:predicted HicB family RNase H-like nuclease
MAKVLLNVRIDPELRQRLQAVAHEQNRTLSNLVETELKRLVGMVAPAPTEPPKNRRG